MSVHYTHLVCAEPRAYDLRPTAEQLTQVLDGLVRMGWVDARGKADLWCDSSPRGLPKVSVASVPESLVRYSRELEGRQVHATLRMPPTPTAERDDPAYAFWEVTDVPLTPSYAYEVALLYAERPVLDLDGMSGEFYVTCPACGENGYEYEEPEDDDRHPPESCRRCSAPFDLRSLAWGERVLEISPFHCFGVRIEAGSPNVRPGGVIVADPRLLRMLTGIFGVRFRGLDRYF